MKTTLWTFFFILAMDQCLYASQNPADSTKKEQDSRRWYQPDFIPFQFAGNIGLLSTGLGITSRSEKYGLALMYGYVPASVAQVPIHNITLKNVFPLASYFLKSHQSVVPYLGLAVTIEVGGNAFLVQPSHFSKSYYDFPKAVHATIFGGLKMQHFFESDFPYLRGIAFYAEAGTVDFYVWYKTISQEVKFGQMFSLALGINFLLPQ